MKALTVRQPWAWAIIHGGKDVENRTRRTNYRGQLYIHSAQAFDDIGYESDVFNNAAIERSKTKGTLELPKGQVIGTVDVIGCHHASKCHFKGISGKEYSCSPWAQLDAWHWELANPRPLACPFPEKGKLGIWNILPQAVA